MKNSLTDVRNHLIAQLESLGDESLTGEKLKETIERGRAMNEIVKTLVDSAKIEVEFIKATSQSERAIIGSGFIRLP